MFNLIVGLIGLILLSLGSELLIRAGKSLGQRFGLSTTTIGVIVIGYGTSLPELSSSYMAAFQGRPEIAAGNVLGSNIFNILFVLGLSAMITPLAVNRELLKKSLPLMMILSLFTFFGVYLGISLQLLGIALLMSFVAFCIYTVRSSDDSDVESSLSLGPIVPLPKALVFLLLGISFLVGGTGFFIQGAVWIAKLAGISESVIGLSIVAIGTSLPEVFTSVLAAIKKERSLVLGNIIGSNIFNLSAALGGTLVLSGPFGFGAFQIDLVVMLLSALICGPFFYSGRRVSRAEGAVLLSFYVAYFIWLLNKT